MTLEVTNGRDKTVSRYKAFGSERTGDERFGVSNMKESLVQRKVV